MGIEISCQDSYRVFIVIGKIADKGIAPRRASRNWKKKTSCCRPSIRHFKRLTLLIYPLRSQPCIQVLCDKRVIVQMRISAVDPVDFI